ncbi:unnamed protein product [Arabis nemorensis]|uniref:Uncharacterized protein n=1 Tax=Arabis nemorensis TaxID=586526 RepID=A0A565AVB6_9BRAS|nr:unnamed protein product [Arabis nemorensis]
MENGKKNSGDLVKLIPGRVPPARLAYDTNDSTRKVHNLLSLYNKIDVPNDRIIFKIPATWQGLRLQNCWSPSLLKRT